MHGKLPPDQHGSSQQASLQLWGPQHRLRRSPSRHFHAKISTDSGKVRCRPTPLVS